MSTGIKFGCLPTAIGSMPHTNAEEACRLVLTHLPVIPAWPQLPRRSFRENMYAQFSQGFPGIIVEGDRIYVDRGQDIALPLEQLYIADSEGDLKNHAISRDYAAGLHDFLSLGKRFAVVKGQITGPITWGLSVGDQGGLPIIYDETMADAVVKHLRLKAAWQEKALSQISPTTIIFVDEPYLASLGSFASLTLEQVVSSVEEVLAGIKGLKGVHCCGSTDWTLLLKTSINILSFDAYSYADSLNLYPTEVKSFLEREGTIAWGIVPNDEEALAKETIASLRDRLEEAMAPFTREGIRFRQLIEQGLLTPSCGLAYLSPEAAEQALELLAGLSTKLRQRYIS